MIVIFIVLVLAFILAFAILMPFYVDKGMTKDCSDVKNLKRSNYKELEKLFLSEDWDFDYRFPNSLFSDNAYCHAGIIRFGDIGYLVDIISYFRIIILQRKIRKNLKGFNKYRKPYIK